LTRATGLGPQARVNGPQAGSEGLQARYDETPYRDQVFEHLDLSRLLGLGRLFGLRSAHTDASQLRVLDLACASGLHIRQQAERYPGVRFTGVDFSRPEIELGRKALAERAVENVELLHADLRELEIPAGEFDVILCSGAFSWVPDDVKERVFELCRIGLAPTGVAAIAYLTYPGWKQREAIRELLAFRARGLEDPAERLRESALLLRLLKAGYSAHPESVHAASLQKVVEDMQASSANVFVHDELGAIHDPCYFTHFVEWAAEWGLQYLAEADLGTMALGGLPDEAKGLLQGLAPDFLETQQLIDFLVNRSGRTSLVVRADASLGRELSVERLQGLSFGTTLVEVTALNALAEAPRCFETLRGLRVEVAEGVESRLLHQLQEAEPTGVPLSEIERWLPGDDRDALTRSLLALLARGHVDVHEPFGGRTPPAR